MWPLEYYFISEVREIDIIKRAVDGETWQDIHLEDDFYGPRSCMEARE